MLGEIETFDFILAMDLHKTLEEIHSLSNLEWVSWHSYYLYRQALEEAKG